MKTNWFGFTDKELEIANVFIQDGWQGDLYTLQKTVELLNDSFNEGEDL